MDVAEGAELVPYPARHGGDTEEEAGSGGHGKVSSLAFAFLARQISFSVLTCGVRVRVRDRELLDRYYAQRERDYQQQLQRQRDVAASFPPAETKEVSNAQ